MNLFKSPVTSRLALIGLLALPISTMVIFLCHKSFAELNPNGYGDFADDYVKYDLRTQAACTQEGSESSPKPPVGGAAGWYQGLNSELDQKNLKGGIAAYKIKWSNGWSVWYVKGVNDIDIKYNPNNNTLRRMWSYFTDHEHLYIICRQPE